MEILKNFDLTPLNTFRVKAKASSFIRLKTLKDVEEFARSKDIDKSNLFVLGGGSNVLFAKDYDGLIVSCDLKGVRYVSSDERTIAVEAMAGENWSDFVEICVKNKLYGLENLADIPGKVGAAPVQNIGAYGVEQKDSLLRVRGFFLDSGEKFELKTDELDFGYRTSAFKTKFKNALITSAEYLLSRNGELNLAYKDLKNELAKFPWVEPDLQYAFEAVRRIRARKLPPLDKYGSAGSFFKNPSVSPRKLEELKSEISDLPYYPDANGAYKIPAARLIELCGFKGKRCGRVGVYEKHSLVIVNYGGATGAEIFDFSEKIRESVLSCFGVELEREVIVL